MLTSKPLWNRLPGEEENSQSLEMCKPKVKSSNYSCANLRSPLLFLGLAIPGKLRVKNSEFIQKSPGGSNIVVPGSGNKIPPGSLGLVLPRGARYCSYNDLCLSYLTSIPRMGHRYARYAEVIDPISPQSQP